MTVRELRPLFDQVAQQTFSVADAERYLQLHYSPTARQIKSALTGLVLSLFLGVGLFLIYHGYRALGNQASFSKQSGTVQHWLPLLLFGGFGGFLVLISGFGLASLRRTVSHSSTPSVAAVQSRLSLVATHAITVDEAMQQLFSEPLTQPLSNQSSVFTRLFFGAFLLLVVYFSLQQCSKSYRLLVAGKSTDGTVIAMVPDRKGHTTAPKVRYSVGGNAYELVGATYSSPPAYAVGDQVTILYNPDAPAEAAIRSFSEQWGGPLVAICLAGFFLFFLWGRGGRSKS